MQPKQINAPTSAVFLRPCSLNLVNNFIKRLSNSGETARNNFRIKKGNDKQYSFTTVTHTILAPSFLGIFWSSYLISLIYPKFRQDHLLQNQIGMFLVGVCSLSVGDVTLLPGWIRVAFLVRQPVLDLISD